MKRSRFSETQIVGILREADAGMSSWTIERFLHKLRLDMKIML